MTGIFSPELSAHLQTGTTTLCQCWLISRADGVEMGFTDHDMPLHFDGHLFRADAGLNASALAQATGLSVDNAEAMGALSDDSIREDEIEQGRFDGAEVRSWRVNWADITQRVLQFRGTIGELRRNDNVFHAELRGLTEALNRPVGRVYQKPCTAVLGDNDCRFNLDDPTFSTTLAIDEIEDRRKFVWPLMPEFEEGFFTRGRLEILDGPAEGLWGMIKQDRNIGVHRHIEIWEPIRGAIDVGTHLRIIAGCDKRRQTCSLKFNNLVNFQGFPDLPGEDWIVAVPKSSDPNSGGSLR